MRKSYILIALLVAIVSLGVVIADDDVDDSDAGIAPLNDTVAVNNTTDNDTSNLTDDVVGNEAAGSEDGTNGNVNTDDSGDNKTEPAAGEPLVKDPKKPVKKDMLKTGLPVLALVLVVLSAISVYRRD